jgi:tetratricopeptide (TPR) repeat protein
MVAISMLGVYYNAMGDYKTALEYAKNAIDISKKVNGYYHENTAQAFSVLGDSYFDNGNNIEALEAYQKSIEIAKKSINKNNPNIAKILMGISTSLGRMCYYEKAIPIFQDVININKNIFGPNHVSVIIAEQNLAVTYSNIGEYERAIRILEDLLIKCKKSKSIQKIDLANIKSNLGSMYIEIGKTDLAKSSLEDALATYKSINALNDKLSLIAQNYLAYIMINNGEYKNAIQLIQNCIQTEDKMNRSNTPEYAEMLNNYSLANSKSGFDHEALSASLKSLSIYKRSEGNLSDNAIKALFNVATIHFKMDNKNSLNATTTEWVISTNQALKRIFYLGEAQRLKWASKNINYFLPSCSLSSLQLSDLILSWKGIVLDSLMEDMAFYKNINK